MTSNLDKLAAVVSNNTRTTKPVSFSMPFVLSDEIERLSEQLTLPRSAVVQALLRDALIARDSRHFREFLSKYQHEVEEHGDAHLSDDELSIFDPDRYDWGQMTVEEAVSAAKTEIEAIEKRWSL